MATYVKFDFNPLVWDLVHDMGHEKKELLVENGVYDKIMEVGCLLNKQDKIEADVNKYVEHYRTYLTNVFRIAKQQANVIYKDIASDFNKKQLAYIDEVLAIVKNILLTGFDEGRVVVVKMCFMLTRFNFKQEMIFSFKVVERKEVRKREPSCYLLGKE